jgi:hypothetical protein
VTVLIATVAAFLLVPAAQAFAATATVNIEGSGSGKVSSVGTPSEGSPPIECTYESPGPATGVCEDEMSGEPESSFAGLGLNAFPSVGSEFVGWVYEAEFPDRIYFAGCETTNETCLMATFTGANISITAVFELETNHFPLAVTEEGTGEGTVTSAPAAINCGSECEAEFAEGEEVELSQSAETGSEFIEWGGACSGTGSCEVTMSEAKEVKATFDLEPEPEEFALEISTAGTGEGEVECEVESGPQEPCAAEYPEGTEVALVPEAETGSEFSGWSEDCTGTGACELTMDEAHSVTAGFDLEPTPEFELEVNIAGTGEGEVSCEVESGPQEPCEAEYPEGTEVALVPEAETGSEFVQWSEDCTGTGACELTMDEDHSVTATFDEEEEPEPEEFNLTIVRAGTGSGSVTCNAGACASSYEEGTEVTLAASAASGSAFSGFSGGGCSGAAPCTVTINADTTVTATFTANAKPEDTCATNASLCPPPPPPVVEGTAKAAATASVKSGKASLKLTCTGGPCKGTLQLKAKVKQGKKTKTLVIGKASFSLVDGATITLKVKLSSPAKQELAKGKTLKAKTGGSGISASTVKLKPAKK